MNLEGLLGSYSEVISSYAVIVMVLLGITLVVGLVKKLFKFAVVIVIVALLWGYLGINAASFEEVKQQTMPAVNDIINRSY